MASPLIWFRVPKELQDRLDSQARMEGITPSALARRALAHHLGRPDLAHISEGWPAGQSRSSQRGKKS
jgi:hypothetical protein